MRRKNDVLAGFVLLSGMSSKRVCYKEKTHWCVACVEKAILSLFSPQKKQGMEKIVVRQLNSLAFLVKCNSTVCNIVFLHNR